MPKPNSRSALHPSSHYFCFYLCLHLILSHPSAMIPDVACRELSASGWIAGEPLTLLDVREPPSGGSARCRSTVGRGPASSRCGRFPPGSTYSRRPSVAARWWFIATTEFARACRQWLADREITGILNLRAESTRRVERTHGDAVATISTAESLGPDGFDLVQKALDIDQAMEIEA